MQQDKRSGWIAQMERIASSGWGVAAVLLVVALLTRAWDFGNPVIHVDEQYYLLVGDRMLHGAIPYVDLWDRKPVGLFAIFAAIRLLPGDGVLTYQLVATAFAIGTAWLVRSGAKKLGASELAALAAATAYILWLPLLSGRGGQSPIFYNLFVAAAAVLMLRLPTLAGARQIGRIVAEGALACFLAGLAIQTKYTPAIEGAFFGCAYLWFLRRAGGSWAILAASALLWMALAILPTAAVIGWYWHAGGKIWDAFYFSNFTSITMRRGYPAAKIVGRLAGITSQCLPFIVCTILALRERPWSAEKTLAAGWLAAALIAFAMIGAFFDHYALPLIAPLAMLSALTFTRSRLALFLSLGIGIMIVAVRLPLLPHDGAPTRNVARTIEANSKGGSCPYVYAGDSVLYLLAHACIPTAYAFPSTLAYEPERGATGVDEAAEVKRILDTHPPVIVTLTEPLAPWNEASHALITQALVQDYRLNLQAPREDSETLVYVRRDRPIVK